MRRVLGEQSGSHRNAIAQRVRCLRGDERFAAQHAVLIRKREAHQFEVLLADRRVYSRGCVSLGIAPEAVPINETQVE